MPPYVKSIWQIVDLILTCIEFFNSWNECHSDQVHKYAKIEFNRRSELSPKNGTQLTMSITIDGGTFNHKRILPFRFRGSVRELDYAAR